MIKGNTVTLLEETSAGLDPFGQPIKKQSAIEVENVLVSPTEAKDVVEHAQLYGKKAVYTLGIPKGDENHWEDKEVVIFGKKYRTFGPVVEGIEALVPTEWHKKVMVERYE
jgi:hypothetical protein